MKFGDEIDAACGQLRANEVNKIWNHFI
jgi:adenine C2-methylase RlmN of 23S rRNA A2503 and tRNA A37